MPNKEFLIPISQVPGSGGSGGSGPQGPQGAIQYNSSGAFAGSQATITSAGAITIPAGGSITIADTGANADILLENTTTGTISTTNGSPMLGFQSQAFNGSTVTDAWSIASTVAAGSNGASTLVHAHSGSSGNAAVAVPSSTLAGGTYGLTFTGANFGLAGAPAGLILSLVGTAEPSIRFYSGTTFWSSITNAAGSNVNTISMVAQNNPGQVFISGNLGTSTGAEGVAAVELGNGLTYTEGSGNMIGVSIGPDNIGSVSLNYAPTTGTGGFIPCQIKGTFNPAAGSTTFQGLLIAPTVEGTSSGSTTALVVNPTITTANLTGTNLIASFQSGGTQKGAIDYSGNWYSGSTAGVSAGSFSSITAITATGGIVTQLTGTSDARLKDSVAYDGGLDEILAITPVRYHWNAKGQEHTGLPGEQEFVGFLAQDVQKAIPEAITATEPSKDKTDAYLSLDDRPILAAAINAIKELKAEIEALKSQK